MIAFLVPHLLSLVALFDSDQAEKSLEIVLVRDVDGKTFWDALDEAISPRIKSPTSDDKTALSTFQGIFQNRPLNKGSVILLTWINPSKMLVSTIFSHANWITYTLFAYVSFSSVRFLFRLEGCQRMWMRRSSQVVLHLLCLMCSLGTLQFLLHWNPQWLTN